MLSPSCNPVAGRVVVDLYRFLEVKNFTPIFRNRLNFGQRVSGRSSEKNPVIVGVNF
jgi:hypothetical protein